MYDAVGGSGAEGINDVAQDEGHERLRHPVRHRGDGAHGHERGVRRVREREQPMQRHAPCRLLLPTSASHGVNQFTFTAALVSSLCFYLFLPDYYITLRAESLAPSTPVYRWKLGKGSRTYESGMFFLKQVFIKFLKY